MNLVQKMKPEINRLLVAALRSGEYKQGYGFLVRKSPEGELTYCCLGVLQCLAEKAGITTHTEEVNESSGGIVYRFGTGIHTSIHYLTPEVMAWAGTVDSNPNVTVPATGGMGPVSSPLGAINDSHVPFEAIAQYIEDSL